MNQFYFAFRVALIYCVIFLVPPAIVLFIALRLNKDFVIRVFRKWFTSTKDQLKKATRGALESLLPSEIIQLSILSSQASQEFATSDGRASMNQNSKSNLLNAQSTTSSNEPTTATPLLQSRSRLQSGYSATISTGSRENQSLEGSFNEKDQLPGEAIYKASDLEEFDAFDYFIDDTASIREPSGPELLKNKDKIVFRNYEYLENIKKEDRRIRLRRFIRPIYFLVFIFILVLFNLTSHWFLEKIVRFVYGGDSTNGDEDYKELQCNVLRIVISISIIVSAFASYFFSVRFLAHALSDDDDDDDSPKGTKHYKKEFGGFNLHEVYESTKASEDDAIPTSLIQNINEQKDEETEHAHVSSLSLKEDDDDDKETEQVNISSLSEYEEEQKDEIIPSNKYEIQPKLNPNKGIWIALSGGGIRAASVAFGALQKIQHIQDDDGEPLLKENSVYLPNDMEFQLTNLIESFPHFQRQVTKIHRWFFSIAHNFVNDNNNFQDTSFQGKPTKEERANLLIKIASFMNNIKADYGQFGKNIKYPRKFEGKNSSNLQKVSTRWFITVSREFFHFVFADDRNRNKEKFDSIAQELFENHRFAFFFVGTLLLQQALTESPSSTESNTGKRTDNYFDLRGVSAVSGGGYAGSTYFLWKKEKEHVHANETPRGDGTWIEACRKHMRSRISFLVHWNDEENGESINPALKLWISFMDTIWTIVFMFVTPIVATIAAIFPIIMVTSDMFMHILTKLDEHGVDFPFFKVYCLSPSLVKQKDALTSWEVWISTIKECKFGTKLIKESSCELIEFRDPFPSIFLLTVFGCLFVYILSLCHCLRFGFPCSKRDVHPPKGGVIHAALVVFLSALGFPCSKRDAHPPKGGVIHTTLVLLLSVLGYLGANFVENYKCTDFELTIRSLLFLVILLNTIIPLLSNERYGGVLFFFSSSSLILSLTMNNSTANKSTLHGDHGYSFQNASCWNLIIILAGVLLLASPLLNQLRFYGFSNYYGHRISFSYYPTCQEQEGQNITIWDKFVSLIDNVFLFLRFPFSLRGGFFHINESSMENLIPSSNMEYMSQISVHNVSENYDDPERFAKDWTISKDMLIASSKRGYYSVEVTSEKEEIGYLKAYTQTLVQRIINAHTKILKLRVEKLGEGNVSPNYEIEDLRKIIQNCYQNYREYIGIINMMPSSNVPADDKKISVASVTAVSGGAVSPYLGDQITNYPNSMLSLCGGLCGRWIHIEKVLVKSYHLSIFISIFFTISSIILVFHGVELYHNCGDSFDSCDLALDTDEIDNLFAFDVFLFVVICVSTIVTIFFPDFIQRNRLISHPFMISLVSMLSLPFTWEDISAVYASDGGHYENLGIIPLLLHREVENEDIIISVDASEEQTLESEDETRRKYYEFPSGFLNALRKTREYNADRYIFKYKVDGENLRNFLDARSFNMLSVEDLKLLGCDKTDFSDEQERQEENLQDQEIQQGQQQENERSRFLSVEVTRYDKYYKRKVDLILYHIRPKVSDLENDPGLDLLGPGCCKSRGINGQHFEDDERRNSCRDLGNIGFNEMILDLQQYISILLFLTAIVVMINGVVYLMGMYTFLEIYEIDSDLTVPTLISLLLGILFVVASFATGFRSIGVLLIFISTVPNFLSIFLDKSATLSWFFVILCVFPVIILFVMAVYFSEKIFGTFPNHSTYTMQPFGNKYIFEKYREQGHAAVSDVWRDIKKQN